MKKKNIEVDGDGNQYRPFISVNDVCNIYEKLVSDDKLPSFICNIGSFNLKIRQIAFKICNILKVNKKIIRFKKNSNDKRNYIVGSKNFKKYFGKNFKFSNFKEEVLDLKKKLKKNKIDFNKNTVRMKFYKDILK